MRKGRTKRNQRGWGMLLPVAIAVTSTVTIGGHMIYTAAEKFRPNVGAQRRMDNNQATAADMKIIQETKKREMEGLKILEADANLLVGAALSGTSLPGGTSARAMGNAARGTIQDIAIGIAKDTMVQQAENEIERQEREEGLQESKNLIKGLIGDFLWQWGKEVNNMIVQGGKVIANANIPKSSLFVPELIRRIGNEINEGGITNPPVTSTGVPVNMSDATGASSTIGGLDDLSKNINAAIANDNNSTPGEDDLNKALDRQLDRSPGKINTGINPGDPKKIRDEAKKRIAEESKRQKGLTKDRKAKENAARIATQGKRTNPLENGRTGISPQPTTATKGDINRIAGDFIRERAPEVDNSQVANDIIMQGIRDSQNQMNQSLIQPQPSYGNVDWSGVTNPLRNTTNIYVPAAPKIQNTRKY